MQGARAVHPFGAGCLGGAVCTVRRRMRPVRLPPGRLLLRKRQGSCADPHVRSQSSPKKVTGLTEEMGHSIRDQAILRPPQTFPMPSFPTCENVSDLAN